MKTIDAERDASLMAAVSPMPHRVLATLLLMLAVTGLGLGLSQNPAGATTNPGQSATPYNQGGEWWSTDGCSVVDDSGWWGNFHHACVHHDGCYRHRWASKQTCDWWFWSDMRASCAAMFRAWDPRSGPCNARAYAYYAGVFYFGGPAYNQQSAYIPMNQYV